ncbi:hypothetical protein [Solicola gregarius]|uniref:Uncharacterized protein n=1 Tax=Solicola gregarius TaxID=2908642 RepID=A0AA46TI05_9ACTN|nr:hypothetical protein [Solicola gregarius]UYM05192.1 hypothetical protein L0C25_22170 [Solicola gregarius]
MPGTGSGARAWLRSHSVAASAAGAAGRWIAANPIGGRERWQRTNFAGKTVSLLGGPSAVVGLVAGSVAQRRFGTAAGLSAIGAVGAYDDLYGDSATKGVRGHLSALRGGVVTSGVVKLGVVSAAGVLIARGESSPTRSTVSLLRDGALVAGAANIVNLLDLRPGRAYKAALPAAALPSGGSIGGVITAGIGDDLRGRTMLGDCGSNALGAAIGAAVVRDTPPLVRWAGLAAVVGLTYASERTSFSEFIAKHPMLDRIDRAGRDW